LAWLADLYSGRLTHISGHPSAAGRAQDRESSPARDRRSTTNIVPDLAGWVGPRLIFYFSLVIDAYETTTLLSRIVLVLVRPNFYSAGPEASHQINPALIAHNR